jgi:hypothetical protein
MRTREDTVEGLVEEETDSFAALTQQPVSGARPPANAPTGAVTARFHGFDLDDRPLLAGLPGLPHEIVVARSTTHLSTAQIGATVVVVCEEGDVRRPIVLGVIQERPVAVETPPEGAERPQLVSVRVDDDSLVLSADRQIELKCGEASITLTRAGKVLITGCYVLSRSSGYNKIKGAVVDIN